MLRGPLDARIYFAAKCAEVDGLGKKRLGAILECLAFGLGIAIGGNHNDWDILSLLKIISERNNDAIRTELASRQWFRIVAPLEVSVSL